MSWIPQLLREKAGRQALTAWAISAVVAVLIVGGLAAIGFVHAFLPVCIALTTTALGTLLPILREQNMLTGSFGRFIFAAGAVGELLPILAISLLLGAYKTWWEALIIASIAGMVLRRSSTPGDNNEFEEKLDAVGYGFFIPVFFVSSGMALDVQSIVQNPLRLLVFFVLLLVVRGAPALLVYRTTLPLRERFELMFLTATALPLLVALSKISLASGVMLPENAAALVGAGVLSIAIFPLIATRIHRPTHPALARGTPTD